jgi:glycosyltransferase involved in cell wall biosynthesis
MKVLVLPRDSNPYQGLLYRELHRLGVRIRYVGELTSSQTLNLLLLPLELVALRVGGWRLLHLHWVFGFSFPWARRGGRLAGQLWFGLVLVTCRVIGTRIAWTAHNVLPHDRVFASDLVARRWLVRASSLVVVHDVTALEQLKGLGMVPRRCVVIAPGGYGSGAGARALGPAGSGTLPWTLLFFGKIHPYKGVEDLLMAVAGLDPGVRLRVVVAGACADQALRERLQKLAAAGDGRVELRLGHVPDDELIQLLESSDGVVLPYRTVTTSSSVLLAFEHARPVLVPDLPAFGNLEGAGVRRYDQTIEGLHRSLVQFAALTPSALARASAAAAAQAPEQTWATAAQATYAAFMRAQA